MHAAERKYNADEKIVEKMKKYKHSTKVVYDMEDEANGKTSRPMKIENGVIVSARLSTLSTYTKTLTKI